MPKKRLYPLLILLGLVLSACSSETVKFQAGDMEGDFCGVHLNYQYCKCAFDDNFCEQVAMNKTEAKQYVDEEYDKWIEKEKLNFASRCRSDNGIYDNEECKYCNDSQSVVDGKCKKTNQISEDVAVEELKEGECRADTDCESSCAGDVKWEETCNIGKKICESTFDIDCNANMETFGNFSFPMICSAGECSRDSAAIRDKRTELDIEKKGYTASLRKINIEQEKLTAIILTTNNNCSDDSLTLTDEAITNFATKVDLLMVDTSLDYVDDVMSKLSAYLDGVPAKANKFEVDEYKKLNCDLFDYFELELVGIETKLEEINDHVDSIDELLNSLPVL